MTYSGINRAIDIITPEDLRNTVVDFPENPPLGEVYQHAGITYRWDGEKWTANNAELFDERFTPKDLTEYPEIP